MNSTSNLDCVLAGLAERIDTLHSASLSSHRKSIGQAIDCGRVLAEAKALVAHGQWLPWLDSNTKVDPRTAQRWMRFAENADAVLAKCATSADLTFAEIDRDLSATAVAAFKDAPADLQTFTEHVAELRKGGNVLAFGDVRASDGAEGEGARRAQSSLSRSPGAHRLRGATPRRGP